jgi:hypothetical protein
MVVASFQSLTLSIFGCWPFKTSIASPFHFLSPSKNCNPCSCHWITKIFFYHQLFKLGDWMRMRPSNGDWMSMRSFNGDQMNTWLSNGDQIGLRLHKVLKMNLGFIYLLLLYSFGFCVFGCTLITIALKFEWPLEIETLDTWRVLLAFLNFFWKTSILDLSKL